RHDHCPLELAEHAHHLEHGLAGRRRRVQCLLMEVEINALGPQLVEEGDKVSQRTAKTVDRPGGDQIEIPRVTPLHSLSNAARLPAVWRNTDGVFAPYSRCSGPSLTG